MFGLFVGSLMTLFIIPVMFSLFVPDKRAEKIRQWM
jgi:multidrug efflux pump subunit AcrB